MKTTISFILLVVILVAWIRIPTDPSAGNYNPQHLSLKTNNNDYRCDNLQLYPVYATETFIKYYENLGPYITLEEALSQHKMVITEYSSHGELIDEEEAVEETEENVEQIMEGDGAQVNTLFVENISADTIIILGGEVIRGGKQDRMIAKDFMLLPGSGKIDVSVFCVEHGRWTVHNNDVSFNTMMDIAPAKVRKAGTTALDQDEVWEEVELIVMREDVKITTGALAHALEAQPYTDRMKKYEDCYDMGWPEAVVGVVAIVGSEIVGCDLFASHRLFEKYFHSLLRSYSSEAGWTTEEITVTKKDVDKYLNDVLTSSNQDMKRTQLQHGKYQLHLSALK